jgi:hypothetical protein
MIKALQHKWRVYRSHVHEKKKDTQRSPKWRAVQHAFLQMKPTCAACGSNIELQVHHIKPFHLHPELELQPSNLITMCMSAGECHLLVAHGGSFACYNPNVVEDAATLLRNPQLAKAMQQRAKQNRLS